MVNVSDNNNNNMQDDNAFEMDDDSFNDIDESAFDDFDDTQKGSLKDIWQNNPLLKLAVVGLGLVVIIVAVFLFGGQQEENPSVVQKTTDAKELPGESELTPDMEQRIEEKNEFDYRLAEATGQSQIPISTELPQQGLGPDQDNQQQNVDDPLAEWRSQSLQKTIEEQPPQEEPPVEPIQPQPQVPMQPPVLQPNPEMVAALSQGFGAQMRQILEDKGISAPRHMSVTSRNFMNDSIAEQEAAGLGDNDENGEEEMPTEQLVPAGEVVYAQTLTESNTDAPGPVLAQILSGPLKGSRVIGGFTETEEYLTMNFDRVVYNDEVINVDAVALDVDTTLPGVVTEIDRRYFRRVILPAAAAFIEGFGSAVAQSGSTEVTVEGETVTTEEEDLDTREELLQGVEEGSNKIAEFLEEEGDRIRPMIKVHAGTPIGILFLQPVEKTLD